MVPESAEENLSDLASIFADDFELDLIDSSHADEISNVLCDLNDNKLASQNQIDLSRGGTGSWLNFRPNFSGNCRVEVYISYQKS